MPKKKVSICTINGLISSFSRPYFAAIASESNHAVSTEGEVESECNNTASTPSQRKVQKTFSIRRSRAVLCHSERATEGQNFENWSCTRSVFHRSSQTLLSATFPSPTTSPAARTFALSAIHRFRVGLVEQQIIVRVIDRFVLLEVL